MASPDRFPAALRTNQQHAIERFGLDPASACAALWHIIAADVTQAAVTRHFWSPPAIDLGSRTHRAPAAVAADADASMHDAAATSALAPAEVLREIWRELLGAPTVVETDDFFDLGGHSLLATSLAFQVRQRLGCTITVDEIFSHSLFHAMAALVLARVTTDTRTETFEL